MTSNHTKSDFRKYCIKRLKFNSRFIKIRQDRLIIDRLFNIICELKVKKVLLYIPMDLEVNVLPLINRLRKLKGYEVYVPYMFEDSFKVVKYRLPLDKKRFGIKEPRDSLFYKSKIDLAIVPVVGIDRDYKRIGFGKGMYDRFFYRLSYKPTIIFTQRFYCKTDEKLTDDYDIQADYIVSN